MLMVKFNHNSYGEMTTTAENWINYKIFDAIDKTGDVYPVGFDECDLIETFEQ